MSKNQSGDDLNFKEDSDGEEKPKVDTIGITSKFHPIKQRIRQMEKDIADLRAALNENKKGSMMMKGGLSNLEGTIKEKCNELCKSIMDDLSNFDKDLKRVIQNDRTETNFFKVQTNALNVMLLMMIKSNYKKKLLLYNLE